MVKMNKIQPFEHYFTGQYDTKKRFACYWNQINSVIQGRPTEILEIGVGNKFVYDYLKKHGYQVRSLDYNIILHPDIAGSVDQLPLRSNSFDTVMCCEVLEHLPFDLFAKSLRELERVARNRVVISLPTVERFYRLDAILPKLPNFRRLWECPKRNKPVHHFDGEHYWELGKKGYGKSVVVKTIQESGLTIVDDFRDFDDPIHQFFILEKNANRLNKGIGT